MQKRKPRLGKVTPSGGRSSPRMRPRLDGKADCNIAAARLLFIYLFIFEEATCSSCLHLEMNLLVLVFFFLTCLLLLVESERGMRKALQFHAW